MRTITKDILQILYQEEDLVLGDADGKLYLLLDGRSFWLSDYRLEPCLYLKSSDGKLLTIHHAFTTDELRKLTNAGESQHMISGNDYDIRGICRLLRKAIELSRDSVDSSYLEGHLFLDYLREHGAVSPETAVDPADAGFQRSGFMNPFLHAKKAARTSNDLFYIPAKSSLEPERYFRVISNQVRFGCGYRTVSGRKQYFAWHGYPNRNDDFITTAEISPEEFGRIRIEYPCEIIADRETAELFRKKYVNGHPILLEGWNRTL